MTNLKKHYEVEVETITDTLKAMGCFAKVAVSVVGGDIKANYMAEAFEVEDMISIKAWHKRDKFFDPEIDDENEHLNSTPMVCIDINAYALSCGFPDSDDKEYLDDDGEFDEDKYDAEIASRLEIMNQDPDDEDRLNFLVSSVSLDDSYGNYSYEMSGAINDGDVEMADLDEYLTSKLFAQELADDVANSFPSE